MEIKFKRDTSFRKQFFVPDSFAHPAKMDAQLLIWLVENYTKTWETILDPMAGSGTTMLACGLSRSVILVELEEKFCKMMRYNWAKVRMWPQLGHRMGTCDIIQGDARQLEGLLVDKCIFSPPYAEAYIGGDGTALNALETGKGTKRGRGFDSFGGKTLGKPDSQSNIGNLPYGSIDKIVDLQSGRIDDIIESNGKTLRGMRGTAGPEGERDRSSLPLSEEEVLQSGLPHSQSESSNEGRQADLVKGTDKGNRRTVEGDRGEDKQIKNGQEISQNLNSQEGNIPKRGNQRKDKRLSPEGRESSPMERGVEEVSRLGLGDTTEEGIEAGQLPVPNLRGRNQPGAPSNPLLNEQGQQPTKSSEPMCSLPRQSNGSYSDANHYNNLQSLQTPLVDAVISSPPYEATLDGKGEGPLVTSKKNPHYKPMPSGYSVDAVVTSPPYEGSISGEGKSEEELRELYNQKKVRRSHLTPGRLKHESIISGGYSNSGDNIGNLKSSSYLEAMLQVYAQCWSVLKDGGLMILVTKNFIRNKQIVRLDTDTIKLCEQAGFSFLERHYRKLPSQSFWRVIYHQKHPEVEQINYEDVLVFQKMELKV